MRSIGFSGLNWVKIADIRATLQDIRDVMTSNLVAGERPLPRPGICGVVTASVDDEVFCSRVEFRAVGPEGAQAWYHLRRCPTECTLRIVVSCVGREPPHVTSPCLDAEIAILGHLARRSF